MSHDVGRWFLTAVLRRPVKLPPPERADPTDAVLVRDWLLLAAVLCVASAVGAAALLWAAKPKAKRLQRPPGLVGLLASWVLGNDLSVYLLRFGPNKGHEFFDECCATLGRWFTLRLGPDILIVTTDPVACQDIFVVKKKSFSTRTVPVMVIDWFFKGALPTLHAEQWTHDRALVQGAIAGQRIHLVYPAMHAKLDAIRDRIDTHEGGEFDLCELLPRLLVDVFGEFALGVNLNTMHSQNQAFFEALTSIPAGIQVRMAEPPWTWDLPTRRNLRLRRARATAHAFIRKLLDERSARGQAKTADVLPTECLLDRLLSEGGRGKMSEERVLSNIGIFFIGSFEYISNTLMFTLEFVSKHPEVMRQLRAEQLGIGSVAAGPDALQAAPYLDAVIRESMRLEPTVLGVGRMATEPIDIRTANGPRHVARGTAVFAYNRLMSTDPDVWPGHDDLRAFRPERWMDGSPIPGSAAQFPFGAGRHICPGARPALLQLKMMLSFFVCTYDLELARPMPRSIRLAVGPENGSWFKMTPAGCTASISDADRRG